MRSTLNKIDVYKSIKRLNVVLYAAKSLALLLYADSVTTATRSLYAAHGRSSREKSSTKASITSEMLQHGIVLTINYCVPYDRDAQEKVQTTPNLLIYLN
jgi:hypothetical protein